MSCLVLGSMKMSAKSNMVDWDPYYPGEVNEQDITKPPSPLQYQHNLQIVDDLLPLGRRDEKTSKQDEQNINTGS